MQRDTLRNILVLAIISLAGMISLQIYWFTKAFDLREKQFNQTVNIALHNVANQMLEYYDRPVPQINPVEQLSSNYYVVMLNDIIDAQFLETLLINEFNNRNLKFDFEYGIYDCTSEKMVFGNFINVSNRKGKPNRSQELPSWEDNDYYFGVLFPGKTSILLGQMDIWIFSSFAFFIVLIFFGYAIWIIFRQRQLSETQKQFINNMTHEFRTPISTIMLSADVLRNSDERSDQPRLKNYANIIKEESGRLLKQVEKVLQSAMLDEKKTELKLVELDVHDLIEKIVKRASVQLADDHIHMNLQAKNITVLADEVHFANAIKNVIDNAIKYSGEDPEIWIRTFNQSKSIVIEVEDHGIGIDRKYQSKVFRKFFRVPTGDRHDIKGFGIGLHYVKNIVKLHHGSIALRSQPGKGTCFTTSIPVI